MYRQNFYDLSNCNRCSTNCSQDNRPYFNYCSSNSCNCPLNPVCPAGVQGPTGPQGPAGIQGPIGPRGPQGVQGPAGINGVDGTSATVTVGSTTTGVPGSQASVINVGTDTNAILNFVIPAGTTGATGATGPAGPQGIQGPAGINGVDGTSATVTVGNTTTGVPGSQASVINVGTTTNAILDFIIPAGEPGTITPGVGVATLDATATIDEVITTVNALITSLTNAGFLAN